jgi:drug/metabolite transporter (DMT)-like permease
LNQRSSAYLALVVGVIALAFSPIFVSLAQVNGLAATLYRTSISSGVLLVPFLLRHDNRLGTATTRPGWWKSIAIGAIGGFLFALNNALFNTSITLMAASRAVFLSNTSVIWVGLFSMFVFREKLSLQFWGGLILALTGVFLISTQKVNTQDGILLGNFLALLGGFFYGLYLLFNSTARRYLNALSYMVLSNLASSLLLFWAVLIVGVPYYGFSSSTYVYLLGLGIISHAIGFLAIIHAQAYLPPSTVSTILLVQPPLVLVLSMVLLHEKLLGLQLAGMGVLFLGIILANQRKIEARIAAAGPNL